MKNFWLRKIDRALRALGYLPQVIDQYQEEEKERLLIDEYLWILNEDDDDCVLMSSDEIAEYIINRQKHVA